MRHKATFAPWIHAQAAGLLLGLAFAVDGAGPLAWVAVWLLTARLDERGAWERLGDGSLAGIWWAGLTVGPWLYDAALVPVGGVVPAVLVTAGAIVLYGALYVALFTLAWPRLPGPRWLSGPALWVLLEVVRSEVAGGAPWALLGHSQHAWLGLAQVADVGGVPLVSFIVAMPGMALADGPVGRRRGIVATALVMGVVVGYGTAQLVAYPGRQDAGVVVRAVSGGHLSSDRVLAYLAATKDGPRSDIVVWPETAIPGYLQDDPGALVPVVDSAKRHGAMMVGTPRHETAPGGAQLYFNSAVLVDERGILRGSYDKRRLVPFAERAPRGAPELLARPFTAGAPDAPVLQAAGLRLGPLVCWEALFPALTRAWVEAGADLLVNLTSDQDLGDGARQLLAYSRFRAIESRRWLLRASGTGVSVMIDPAGRIFARDLVRIVPGAAPQSTPYVRYPHAVPIVAVALVLALYAWRAVRTRRRPSV